MLGDILVCGGGLHRLSPDIVQYICLGEALLSGNMAPTSTKSNDAQSVFSGLLGLLSLGDDRKEHEDPTAVAMALLADCASRLASCGRVDTWMEELHDILCAQMDQLVQSVRTQLDSVQQKLVNDVSDPLNALKEGMKTEPVKGRETSFMSSVFGGEVKPQNAESVRKQLVRAR